MIILPKLQNKPNCHFHSKSPYLWTGLCSSWLHQAKSGDKHRNMCPRVTYPPLVSRDIERGTWWSIRWVFGRAKDIVNANDTQMSKPKTASRQRYRKNAPTETTEENIELTCSSLQSIRLYLISMTDFQRKSNKCCMVSTLCLTAWTNWPMRWFS